VSDRKHMCDSCSWDYPECPANGDSVEFEDGFDNIISCEDYQEESDES